MQRKRLEFVALGEKLVHPLVDVVVAVGRVVKVERMGAFCSRLGADPALEGGRLFGCQRVGDDAIAELVEVSLVLLEIGGPLRQHGWDASDQSMSASERTRCCSASTCSCMTRPKSCRVRATRPITPASWV